MTNRIITKRSRRLEVELEDHHSNTWLQLANQTALANNMTNCYVCTIVPLNTIYALYLIPHQVDENKLNSTMTQYRQWFPALGRRRYNYSKQFTIWPEQQFDVATTPKLYKENKLNKFGRCHLMQELTSSLKDVCSSHQDQKATQKTVSYNSKVRQLTVLLLLFQHLLSVQKRM